MHKGLLMAHRSLQHPPQWTHSRLNWPSFGEVRIVTYVERNSILSLISGFTNSVTSLWDLGDLAAPQANGRRLISVLCVGSSLCHPLESRCTRESTPESVLFHVRCVANVFVKTLTCVSICAHTQGSGRSTVSCVAKTSSKECTWLNTGAHTLESGHMCVLCVVKHSRPSPTFETTRRPMLDSNNRKIKRPLRLPWRRRLLWL